MKLPLKASHKITSPFGERIHPISGKRSHHNGVDLISYGDQTIYAPIGGKITEARKSTAPGGGYGQYVKMLDTDGNEHIFAHMKNGSFKVKKGDTVKTGDALGTIGATGNVTGPHLHWEVRVKGKFTDPMDHLDAPEKPQDAPQRPQADSWVVHTVKRGDTVWALSRRYGVTVKEIADWNKMKNASVIRVGQKLRIKQ